LANSKLALIAKPKTKQGRDPKTRFKDKDSKIRIGISGIRGKPAFRLKSQAELGMM
jgi:hypothetical protein